MNECKNGLWMPLTDYIIFLKKINISSYEN